MFVFLSKLLPQFVYPLGLAVGLVVLALLLKRRRSAQTVMLILALSILWLGGNQWVSDGLTRSLEWQYLPEGELPVSEMIVILGGGTESMAFPRQTPELNSAGDRVFYGAYLYHQGKAPRILLSGGRIEWMNDFASTPASEMAEVLLVMGVPEDAILLEELSLNTYENAVNSAAMLRELGISRVLLVTSAMHMPRSVALFERQGIAVIPAPTDFKVTQAGWEGLFAASWQTYLINLFPDVGNLNQTTAALKEYIGMFVYRLRGWM
jgi:uncharacterized SAM-binding protein YcdF (DUF218 family)